MIPANATDYRQSTNSQIRRDIEAIDKVPMWLTENNPFHESRDPEKLVSFSSGLVSNRTDAVNANNAFNVQRKLDDKLFNKSMEL